jgi:hypothetical protein
MNKIIERGEASLEIQAVINRYKGKFTREEWEMIWLNIKLPMRE